MLRRLEKRILVDLPTSAARQAMISHWLPPLSAAGGVELRTELDYEALATVRYGSVTVEGVRLLHSGKVCVDFMETRACCFRGWTVTLALTSDWCVVRPP